MAPKKGTTGPNKPAFELVSDDDVLDLADFDASDGTPPPKRTQAEAMAAALAADGASRRAAPPPPRPRPVAPPPGYGDDDEVAFSEKNSSVLGSFFDHTLNPFRASAYVENFEREPDSDSFFSRATTWVTNRIAKPTAGAILATGFVVAPLVCCGGAVAIAAGFGAAFPALAAIGVPTLLVTAAVSPFIGTFSSNIALAAFGMHGKGQENDVVGACERADNMLTGQQPLFHDSWSAGKGTPSLTKAAQKQLIKMGILSPGGKADADVQEALSNMVNEQQSLGTERSVTIEMLQVEVYQVKSGNRPLFNVDAPESDKDLIDSLMGNRKVMGNIRLELEGLGLSDITDRDIKAAVLMVASETKPPALDKDSTFADFRKALQKLDDTLKEGVTPGILNRYGKEVNRASDTHTITGQEDDLPPAFSGADDDRLLFRKDGDKYHLSMAGQEKLKVTINDVFDGATVTRDEMGKIANFLKKEAGSDVDRLTMGEAVKIIRDKKDELAAKVPSLAAEKYSGIEM